MRSARPGPAPRARPATRAGNTPLRRCAAAALLAAGIAAGVAAPVAAAVQDPPALDTIEELDEDTVRTGPEVEAVRFPGADALETDRLRRAIATRATTCRSPLFFWACAIGDWDWAERKEYLDADAVPDDARRLDLLYEAWGYPDAEVESRVIRQADGDVVVEFRIDEGEPILVESVRVVGLDRLSPPVELRRPLPLRAGEPYGLPRLEATQERILAAFAERGRPYAEVEVGGDVDEAARRASVVLDVAPGPAAVFGPVSVAAEPPIEEEVVRERIAYRPGEPYRPSATRETELALYRLPIVERVVIEPAPVAGRGSPVRTRIVVGARDARGYRVEGSLSSTECVELASFWNDRYFLGGPRLFSLGVGVSNIFAKEADGFPCTSAGDDRFAVVNYFVRTDLRQPWPGSPRTDLLVSLYARRESAPNAYVETGYGARIGGARLLRPRLTVSAVYEPSRNELDAAGLFFCGNFGVCGQAGIRELSEFNWLSPVAILVQREPEGGFRRVVRPGEVLAPWDRPARPWRWWLRAGLESAYGYTGSDFDYMRTVVEASATRAFGRRFELAGRARVGVIAGGGALPPQIRLYSGGVNTVRGFPQNLLGPKVLAASPENALTLGCAIEVGGCPPGLVVDEDDDLVGVRPLGGDAVLEANLEARAWLTQTVQAAAFLDYGGIGRGLLGDRAAVPFVTETEGTALTPGIGVRFLTGLGAIRIDAGYDATGGGALPLFTEDPATGAVVPLGRVRFRRFDGGFLGRVWDRIQLHVAIGQPF